ncbi:MAG: hypothetical protein ACYDG6_02570 [Thermincolia bacterium]
MEFTQGTEEFSVLYRAEKSMADQIHNTVLATVVAPKAREILGHLGPEKQR